MTQTAVSAETNTVVTGEVRAAVIAFAEALETTPEFQAFEEGAVAFKQDRTAQEGVRLFQEKQRSLKMMQQLGMLTEDELGELKRLRETMMNQPSVRAYVEAQDELTLVCRAAATQLSAALGLDFARACAPGCC